MGDQQFILALRLGKQLDPKSRKKAYNLLAQRLQKVLESYFLVSRRKGDDPAELTRDIYVKILKGTDTRRDELKRHSLKTLGLKLALNLRPLHGGEATPDWPVSALQRELRKLPTRLARLMVLQRFLRCTTKECCLILSVDLSKLTRMRRELKRAIDEIEKLEHDKIPGGLDL